MAVCLGFLLHDNHPVVHDPAVLKMPGLDEFVLIQADIRSDANDLSPGNIVVYDDIEL